MYTNYSGRNYRNKVRKLKIRNRVIAILLASFLGIGGYVLAKTMPSEASANNTMQMTSQEMIPTEIPVEKENYAVYLTPEPTVIPTPVPTPVPTEVPVIPTNNYNRGDSVISTTDVNMRLGNSKDTFKLGVLPAGSVVDRIASEGDWDLVRYNNQIAYVHTDYTRTNDYDYNNEYYQVEKYNDIVRTTSRLNFRVGPSTKEKDLFMLDKDEECVVIGKAITNANEVWYLVKARGQIGFVNASYTTSLRSALTSMFPEFQDKDIVIKKLGYLKNNATVYDQNKNVIGYEDQYQLVEVLQENDNYALVIINGKLGIVAKRDIQKMSGSFVAVDISSQRICYYVNNEVAFSGRCTTGKKSSPTELGCYEPYGKGPSHDFGDNHQAKILWMPFNGGQGLHDAPWEPNSKFGDYSYTKSKGSAGCVRLPDDVARFIYDNVSKSTKVLVKQ